MELKGLTTSEYDTFPKLLLRNYRHWPKQLAMCRKAFGIWARYTWEDSYHIVQYLSLAMIHIGFRSGDGLAIIGDNDPEWYWGMLAAQSAGGWAVGIYADASTSEVKYYLEHSRARLVLARDQEQVDKVLEIKEEVSKLLKVIYWEPKGLSYYEDSLLVSLSDIIEMGKKQEKEHINLLEVNIQQGRPEDIALMPYTSGVTGPPKGVPLTHRNLIASCTGFLRLLGSLEPKDNYPSIFTPAHISETVFGLGPHLLNGVVVNFPENPETFEQDAREVGAQIVGRMAKSWENMASRILVRINASGFLRRAIFHLSIRLGYMASSLHPEHDGSGLFGRVLHALASWFVFGPLKDQFGLAKVRFPMCSGAFLSPDAFKFLNAMGIQILNSYGTTETAGLVAVQSPGDLRAETVGIPLSSTQIKISNEGEILIRGDQVFSGYHRDAEASEKALRDGWFHTGDAGHITEDGHLIFFDRMSELWERDNDNGRKYAPSYLESCLRFSPYIKEALVLGGKQRAYVSAIINMDFESVGKWAESKRISYTAFFDLSQRVEVADLISKEIDRVNSTLPAETRIRRYVLFSRGFDPEEGELTRTWEIKRGLMEQKFAHIIEAIYGDEEVVSLKKDVSHHEIGRDAVPIAMKIRWVKEVQR